LKRLPSFSRRVVFELDPTHKAALKLLSNVSLHQSMQGPKNGRGCFLKASCRFEKTVTVNKTNERTLYTRATPAILDLSEESWAKKRRLQYTSQQAKCAAHKLIKGIN